VAVEKAIIIAFSTATVVARTRLSVSFYAHFPVLFLLT
jgi:hypothetical protein